MFKAIGFLVALLAALPSQANTLILVSIDGFRWDYLDIHSAPNLNRIAQSGVRATRMQPVYPSKTFPAHLSLATGLPPVEHGIVDNKFCDRERGQCYRLGDGGKDSSWIRGIPIWNLVELHGHKAATFFWPESDARIGGQTPTYHYHYAKPAPYEDRVTQVIDWLRLPAPARPRLVTLYFSLVDTMGHEFGPNSPELAGAVAEVDQHLGRLWDEVRALSDDVNVMIVSDHGMAEVRGDAAIDVSSLPLFPDIKVINSGTHVTYYRESADADIEGQREALEDAADGRYRVVNEAILAARGVSGPRTPDIIIETLPPAIFRNKASDSGSTGGTHGYPPDLVDEMAAFLVAAGPAFREGTVIPEIHQLDVYPVAAKVLGVEPLSKLHSDGGALLGGLTDTGGDGAEE